MTTATHLIAESGLRRTPAREAILELLTEVGRPLSHHDIIHKGKGIKCLDRVTVYRTLETLLEAGILHRIQGTDGIWRFCRHRYDSPGQCAGNHVHFLCSGCGQMSCLPEQPLPWVSAPSGARIHSKQLVVHGQCAACLSRDKAGKSQVRCGCTRS